MRKIWEPDRAYAWLRPYVDYCTRLSYKKIDSSGALPADGAVIISPNHTNTLMDALVVLQSRKDPTVFGARADIFRSRTAARILGFLRILPLVRSRDGLREVTRNRESFLQIDEALAHHVPFCIFSEGRHRPMHSLLPLQKGVARLALASAASRQTWLVPAGIDYGDFFRYRSTCTLKYGEPIDVNRFVADHAGLVPAEMIRQLLGELSQRMKDQIRYVPDDGDYDRNWSQVQPPPPTAFGLAGGPVPLVRSGGGADPADVGDGRVPVPVQSVRPRLLEYDALHGPSDRDAAPAAGVGRPGLLFPARLGRRRPAGLFPLLLQPVLRLAERGPRTVRCEKSAYVSVSA